MSLFCAFLRFLDTAPTKRAKLSYEGQILPTFSLLKSNRARQLRATVGGSCPQQINSFVGMKSSQPPKKYALPRFTPCLPPLPRNDFKQFFTPVSEFHSRHVGVPVRTNQIPALTECMLTRFAPSAFPLLLRCGFVQVLTPLSGRCC